MKTYFKICLAATALFITTSASAQLPISLGIKGGVNMSNFSGDVNDKSAKAGFHVGIVADIDLPVSNLGILTGLEYTAKGAKYKVDPLLPRLEANANYLQLPAHLRYKFDLMPSISLIAHGGPYFAYGVDGKIKQAGDKIDTFGKNGLDRFDWGLGAGIGARVWKLGVDLGVDFGLKNIGDKDVSVKNQNAYFSVSYFFM